tara:strand:+ start:26089 stop:26904 length:816 start_codon:yes stop_codon:yes gene_type:complete
VKTTSIITGGAGGMGLAVATLLGKEHHVVLGDIDPHKLNTACNGLLEQGIQCDGHVCNITQKESVDSLFKAASDIGPIQSVVHCAGISPQMSEPARIMRINALGTINITEAALAHAHQSFALINVASMAAYMIPPVIVPRRSYRYAFSDTERFLKQAMLPCKFIPKGLYRNGLAYSISKHFVIWYSKKNAALFGQRGGRIVSVSPGSFDTEMGRIEERSGSAEMVKRGALKRLGRVEEIAELLAFCAGSNAGYLTGTDILCDGGVIASKVK